MNCRPAPSYPAAPRPPVGCGPTGPPHLPRQGLSWPRPRRASSHPPQISARLVASREGRPWPACPDGGPTTLLAGSTFSPSPPGQAGLPRPATGSSMPPVPPGPAPGFLLSGDRPLGPSSCSPLARFRGTHSGHTDVGPDQLSASRRGSLPRPGFFSLFVASPPSSNLATCRRLRSPS